MIESIIGHAFLPLRGTKRPIIIAVTFNSDADVPIITLKKDPLLNEQEDTIVSFNQLQEELNKRNEIVSEINHSPITIKYESNKLGTVTIIDTPGIPFDVNTSDKEEREKLVIDYCKPVHRFILCVEFANQWDKLTSVDFVKKLDVKLTRTLFVWTNLHSILQQFVNPNDFQQFITKKPSEFKGLFVTLCSKNTRDNHIKNTNDNDIKILLCKANVKDNELLQTLKFDVRRNENMIGIQAIRSHVLEYIWKTYKENIPEIRKTLTNNKKYNVEHLTKIKELYTGLDINKLRSLISNYVADWLQVIVQLIDGSTEGIPSINGQMLQDEDLLLSTSWFSNNNINNNNTTFNSINSNGNQGINSKNFNESVIPAMLSIRTGDLKLYGGSQLERTLELFKNIVQQPVISTIDSNDIEEAATLSLQINQFEIIKISSQIAKRRSEIVYRPLINHLCNRAQLIMTRLSDIAFNILETRRTSRITSRNIGDLLVKIKGFTYFQGVCKDIYQNYIDSISHLCLEKMNDELQCSELLYWDSGDQLLQLNKQNDTTTTILTVSGQIFDDLQDTLTTNILLKAHHYFLVVM